MENEGITKIEKPSLFAMFWSPGEQFRRIRENPRIWGALLIVTIIFTIAFLFSAMSLTPKDLMAQGINEEQAELLMGFTKAATIVTGILTPIIGILFSTIIYFIIIKIAKKDTTFKQLFSMNTYIMIIGAIGALLNNGIQALIGGTTGIYVTSLAGLLNSDSAVLATFELFTIWGLVVSVIGLQKVGQLSKGAAWTIQIVFFLIGLGFAYLGTLFEGIAGI